MKLSKYFLHIIIGFNRKAVVQQAQVQTKVVCFCFFPLQQWVGICGRKKTCSPSGGIRVHRSIDARSGSLVSGKTKFVTQLKFTDGGNMEKCFTAQSPGGRDRRKRTPSSVLPKIGRTVSSICCREQIAIVIIVVQQTRQRPNRILKIAEQMMLGIIVMAMAIGAIISALVQVIVQV